MQQYIKNAYSPKDGGFYSILLGTFKRAFNAIYLKKKTFWTVGIFKICF